MKLIHKLLLLCLLAVPAVAQTVVGGGLAVSCNAVTTTGPCTAFALAAPNGQLPGAFTWQTQTTGSPASVSITLEGSIDGTTWTTVDTSTSTSGEIRSIVGKPMRQLRCNLGTFSGGAAPTMTCQFTVSTAGIGSPPSTATGTVTNIATSAPITGGPITTTGTIGCATCVTNTGASLPNNTVVLGNTAPDIKADTALSTDGAGAMTTTTGNTALTHTQGTITTSKPTLSQTATWNAGGVAFTNWLSNVTCTAAATASKLLDLQIGGASALSLTFNAANCGTSTQLNVGKTSAGGIIGLVGGTSGTATITGPAAAGTLQSPFSFSNGIFVNELGTAAQPAFNVGVNNGANGTGWYGDNLTLKFSVNGVEQAIFRATHDDFKQPICDYNTGNNCITFAPGLVTTTGTGNPLYDGNNACRVTADIALSTSATNVCLWNLPATAHAWGWQCQILWAVTAGTTPTLAIGANPSQTPTGTTNGAATILATNADTGTEGSAAISASGTTTLLTSGTLTTSATVFQASSFGTLLASGTAGTFAINMTGTGASFAGAAKAGSTCYLY